MRRLIAINGRGVIGRIVRSLLAPWWKSLGYESVAQGWLNSIMEIAGAVVAVTGGIIADKYGRKGMYTVGEACGAAIGVLS